MFIIDGDIEPPNGPEVFIPGPEAFIPGPEAFIAGPGTFIAGPGIFIAGPGIFIAGPEIFIAEELPIATGELPPPYVLGERLMLFSDAVTDSKERKLLTSGLMSSRFKELSFSL